jgi:hypothetical protein
MLVIVRKRSAATITPIVISLFDGISTSAAIGRSAVIAVRVIGVS